MTSNLYHEASAHSKHQIINDIMTISQSGMNQLREIYRIRYNIIKTRNSKPHKANPASFNYHQTRL